MRVAVGGGAVEEAQDLGNVVLVHAHVVQAAHVAIAQGLVLRLPEAELAGQSGQVGEPPGPERGVAPDVEDHLVQRQGLVTALDVTHRGAPSG